MASGLLCHVENNPGQGRDPGWEIVGPLGFWATFYHVLIHGDVVPDPAPCPVSGCPLGTVCVTTGESANSPQQNTGCCPDDDATTTTTTTEISTTTTSTESTTTTTLAITENCLCKFTKKIQLPNGATRVEEEQHVICMPECKSNLPISGVEKCKKYCQNLADFKDTIPAAPVLSYTYKSSNCALECDNGKKFCNTFSSAGAGGTGCEGLDLGDKCKGQKGECNEDCQCACKGGPCNGKLVSVPESCTKVGGGAGTCNNQCMCV